LILRRNLEVFLSKKYDTGKSNKNIDKRKIESIEGLNFLFQSCDDSKILNNKLYNMKENEEMKENRKENIFFGSKLQYKSKFKGKNHRFLPSIQKSVDFNHEEDTNFKPILTNNLFEKLVERKLNLVIIK